MPFVNITIYEGHGKERKDEIARRVTDTITDVCKLPREAVWVVFNEVTPPDWYVAWDERAAIMEYEGRLPRERAEAAALDDIRRQMCAVNQTHEE